MGRVIGIDFGLKRIGLAISDANCKIALPLETVTTGIEGVCKVIESRKKEIDSIVIGLPLLLSGIEGDMAKLVKNFGEKLFGRLQIPIQYIDERLSSKATDSALKEMQMKRKERSKIIDRGSAALLLQMYLDLMR